MSKVRIAFVIDSIASPTAGPEEAVTFLLRHLDRNKFQPYLCACNRQMVEKDFDICPLYVVELGHSKTLSRSSVSGGCKHSRREKIDIVQTHFRDSNIAGLFG
jgi:hypothetical protein